MTYRQTDLRYQGGGGIPPPLISADTTLASISNQPFLTNQ